MKILLVDDDFLSRKLLNKLLSPLGEVDVAINGQEAIDAVSLAIGEHQPYRLICMDIMMPEVNGLQALKNIRQQESQHGFTQETRAKVIMTSALSDKDSVTAAAKFCCDAYIIKPIRKARLLDEIHKFGLGLDVS